MLERLVARKLPRLAAHLGSLRVTLGSVTGPWLASLFVSALPPEVLVRVWDCVMVEGAKVLQRVGLALLRLYETTVVAVCFPDVMKRVLDLRVSRTGSAEELLGAAFKGIGSLPSRDVEAARAAALAELSASSNTAAAGVGGAAAAAGGGATGLRASLSLSRRSGGVAGAAGVAAGPGVTASSGAVTASASVGPGRLQRSITTGGLQQLGASAAAATAAVPPPVPSAFASAGAAAAATADAAAVLPRPASAAPLTAAHSGLKGGGGGGRGGLGGFALSLPLSLGRARSAGLDSCASSSTDNATSGPCTSAPSASQLVVGLGHLAAGAVAQGLLLGQGQGAGQQAGGPGGGNSPSRALLRRTSSPGPGPVTAAAPAATGPKAGVVVAGQLPLPQLARSSGGSSGGAAGAGAGAGAVLRPSTDSASSSAAANGGRNGAGACAADAGSPCADRSPRGSMAGGSVGAGSGKSASGAGAVGRKLASLLSFNKSRSANSLPHRSL